MVRPKNRLVGVKTGRGESLSWERPVGSENDDGVANCRMYEKPQKNLIFNRKTPIAGRAASAAVVCSWRLRALDGFAVMPGAGKILAWHARLYRLKPACKGVPAPAGASHSAGVSRKMVLPFDCPPLAGRRPGVNRAGRRGLAACLLVLLSWSFAARCAALETLGYAPRLHERFYVGEDRAFIGEGHDWSRTGDWTGIGRYWDINVNRIGWWPATMVSENYLLTAMHVHPSRYYDDPDVLPKVRFYRDNDPSGEIWESTLEILPGEWEYTGFQVGAADLWLGKLAETPPEWVRRYPLMKRNQGTNWISFIDPTLYLTGKGAEFASYTSARLGRNTVNHRIGGLVSYDVQSPPGVGADEAKIVGDSGFPSFAITPAGPTLFSINTGPAGGPTMLDFHEEIKTALAARGERVAVVTDLWGDLDADYDVDEQDLAILESHFSVATGRSYIEGDMNRDGTVDQDDRFLMTAQLGKLLRAPADFNQDDVIDESDFSIIALNWVQSVEPFTNGDASGDGVVNRDDILTFEANRIDPLAGRPPRQIPGDANFDGFVNNADLQLWAANLGRDDVAPPYSQDGDVTGDPLVNHDDLVVIRDAYGKIFADVDGDSRVTLDDIDVIIANWQQTVPGGAAEGDLDLSGLVDATDLAAAGAQLGSVFRQPQQQRNAGIVPGDFNGDFYIDGVDFLTWQRTLGSTFLLGADANKNGVVDGIDLSVWIANFEATPPAAAATSAVVPEPACRWLAVMSLMAALSGRRSVASIPEPSRSRPARIGRRRPIPDQR